MRNSRQRGGARSRVLHAWPYALILAVGLLLLLPGLSEVGFWDPRETIYVQGAREMAERGSLAVAYYRGEALPAESLAYWSIRAGAAVFGLNELGGRIGGVAVALASMLGVYYTVSRLRGRRAGLLSAIVLGTLPQFYLLARQPGPDIWILSGCGLGWLLFCLGWLQPGERRDLHFASAYVCLASAVVAGGLMAVAGAVALPLAVYGAIRLNRDRLQRLLRDPQIRRRLLRHALLIGVTALVIVGPWVGMLASDARHSGTGVARPLVPEESAKPFHFYFRPLIFGTFPWVLFVPMTVTLLIRWRRGDPFERQAFECLMLLASVLTFVFVAMQTGKWPSYISPMLVPAAVLIGLVLDRLLRDRASAAARLSWVVVLLLFVPAMLDLIRDDGIEYLLESVTTNGEVPAALLPLPAVAPLLTVMGLMLAGLTILRSRLLVGGLMLAVIAFSVYYGGIFVPSLDRFKTMKGLCATWKEYRASDRPVGFVGDGDGGAQFYCDASVEPLHESSFLQFMDPVRPAFCIVGREDLEELSKLYEKQFPARELEIAGVTMSHALVANHHPGAFGSSTNPSAAR